MSPDQLCENYTTPLLQVSETTTRNIQTLLFEPIQSQRSYRRYPMVRDQHTLPGFPLNIQRGNWYLSEDGKNPVCKPPSSHSPLQALSFCMLHFGSAGDPEQTICYPALGPLLWWSFNLMSPTHCFYTCQNLSYGGGMGRKGIQL